MVYLLCRMDALAGIKARFGALRKVLDERSRRLVVAAESLAWGRGGLSVVSRATGVSRRVIRQGQAELKQPVVRPAGRIRRPGGGPEAVGGEGTVAGRRPGTLGRAGHAGRSGVALALDGKSVRRLAEELQPGGHRVSYPVVAELLHELGYSLQANRKTKEGDSHPDRNAQFEYLNQKVKRYRRAWQPVISVDTKKKELIGDFKNGGREWRPQGDPERVQGARLRDSRNKAGRRPMGSTTWRRTPPG